MSGGDDWYDRQIFFDPTLSRETRIVAYAISAVTPAGSKLIPPFTALAKLAKVSLDTVSAAIKQLLERGHLRKQGNAYYLVFKDE